MKVERTEEIKKITTDFYNQFAETYWQKHAKPPEQSIIFFNKVLSRPGSLILDLGCGGGRDSLLFQSMGFQVVSVDLSEKMCKAAAEKGLSTAWMDQENICFKPETFDGVWSRVSLLHSPPEMMPRILSDLRKILKPGGVLFLGMKDSEKEIEAEIKTTENGTTYYCYWPGHILANLVAARHFKVRFVLVRGKDFFGERNYFDIIAVAE